MARRKDLKIDNINKGTTKDSTGFYPLLRHSYYRTEKEVRELIRELKELVVQDDSILTITQLLNKKEILKRTFYDWCNKYSEVAEALEFIKQVIGTRKELRGIKGESPVAAIFPYMHMFDPDYAKHDERAAKLKAQNPETPGNITVIIPGLEEAVTEKKDDQV